MPGDDKYLLSIMQTLQRPDVQLAAEHEGHVFVAASHLYEQPALAEKAPACNATNGVCMSTTPCLTTLLWELLGFLQMPFAVISCITRCISNTPHLSLLLAFDRLCTDSPHPSPRQSQCVETDIIAVKSAAGLMAAVGAAGAFSLEAAADGLAELIQQQQLMGCCVVGYSLGARLGLLLAQRHGGLISGAVIISGSPGQRFHWTLLVLSHLQRLGPCNVKMPLAHRIPVLTTFCFLWLATRPGLNFEAVVFSGVEEHH